MIQREPLGDFQQVKVLGFIKKVKGEYCGQHEQGSSHGVNEKLNRCIDATLSPPYTDQKVHRNERGLPKEIEEDQIKRHKNPYHAHFQQKHEKHVGSDFLLYAPTCQYG